MGKLKLHVSWPQPYSVRLRSSRGATLCERYVCDFFDELGRETGTYEECREPDAHARVIGTDVAWWVYLRDTRNGRWHPRRLLSVSTAHDRTLAELFGRRRDRYFRRIEP